MIIAVLFLVFLCVFWVVTVLEDVGPNTKTKQFNGIFKKQS